jgi:hypothetical protein
VRRRGKAEVLVFDLVYCAEDLTLAFLL